MKDNHQQSELYNVKATYLVQDSQLSYWFVFYQNRLWVDMGYKNIIH